MALNLNDFRAIYLPYCIEQKPDGSWLVLNRMYKPVGFNTDTFIDYEDYPVSTNLAGLGPATLAKLSHTGAVTGNRVYLYDDASNPLNGTKEMNSYLIKIRTLAKLSVKRK